MVARRQEGGYDEPAGHRSPREAGSCRSGLVVVLAAFLVIVCAGLLGEQERSDSGCMYFAVGGMRFEVGDMCFGAEVLRRCSDAGRSRCCDARRGGEVVAWSRIALFEDPVVEAEQVRCLLSVNRGWGILVCDPAGLHQTRRDGATNKDIMGCLLLVLARRILGTECQQTINLHVYRLSRCCMIWRTGCGALRPSPGHMQNVGGRIYADYIAGKRAYAPGELVGVIRSVVGHGCCQSKSPMLSTQKEALVAVANKF